jgi:hypothetical protein
MTPNEATRLAKLERDLNVLTLRVRALELNEAKPAAPALPRAPAEPQGVRFITPIERPRIDLPNEAERARIITVVCNRYPTLLPSADSRWADSDRAEFSQNFARAFEWVSTQGRADEVDRTRYVDFWINQAEEYSRLRGWSGNIGGALFAAVIGAGDVKFLPGNNQGDVWAIGLKTFGGRPATDAWRRVLAGQLLPPVAGPLVPDAGSFGVRQGSN